MRAYSLRAPIAGTLLFAIGLAIAAALLLLALGGYVAWYASRWDRMAPPRT